MNTPLRSTLRLLIGLSCGVTLACTAAAQQAPETAVAPAQTPAKRPAFNYKKFPEVKDLMAIQELLQKSKEKARAATVCLQVGPGSGSGVIISEDGLILTAAHVSTGVGKKLTVIMEDGKRYKAESLGLHSDTDAAMVQITDKGKFPFVNIDPAKKSEDVNTKLGDWVFSLGHSGGFNKERGSGLRLGRLVKTSETTINSDCTLIGGDSGGPLFDINGMLIGIHSRVGVVLDENMHVPIHVFHQHWDAMKKGEFIGNEKFAKRPVKPVKGQAFIGIAVEEVENGLKITDVDKSAVAGREDIKIGDILIMVDGELITKKEKLITLMKSKAAGDLILLTLSRDGKETEHKLNLGAR